MKIDATELEKKRQEMFQRHQNMDRLTISVLRSHLLAEQCMNDYIVANGIKRKWLNKKRFWDKMRKCRQLAKKENTDPLWDVLNAANQLRNAIAHGLAVDKITEKMAWLKEKYLATLTETQVAGLEGQPDFFIAESACVTCAGFIATLQSRIDGEASAEAAKA